MHCCKKYGALLLPLQFECKSTDKSKDYCLQLATFGGNCVKQTNLPFVMGFEFFNLSQLTFFIFLL